MEGEISFVVRSRSVGQLKRHSSVSKLQSVGGTPPEMSVDFCFGSAAAMQQREAGEAPPRT